MWIKVIGYFLLCFELLCVNVPQQLICVNYRHERLLNHRRAFSLFAFVSMATLTKAQQWEMAAHSLHKKSFFFGLFPAEYVPLFSMNESQMKVR